MTVSDPSRPPSSAPTVVGPPTPVTAPATAVAASPADPAPPYEQCDECGSPVDAAQRYCVVCGAHRRHVDDPAARYLGQASARHAASRSSAGAAARAPRRDAAAASGRRSCSPSFPSPLPSAWPWAARPNNDDAKLIQALARHQAAVVTTSAALRRHPPARPPPRRSTGRTSAQRQPAQAPQGLDLLDAQGGQGGRLHPVRHRDADRRVQADQGPGAAGRPGHAEGSEVDRQDLRQPAEQPAGDGRGPVKLLRRSPQRDRRGGHRGGRATGRCPGRRPVARARGSARAAHRALRSHAVRARRPVL